MTNQITFFLDLIRLGEEFPKFTPKSSIFTVETKESDVPQCLNRCPVCQCRFFYLTSFVKSCSSHLPEIKALLSETEGAEDSFSQLLTFGQTSKNIEDLAIDSSDVQGESKRTSKQDHDLPQNTDSKVVGLGTFKNEIENTPSTKKHTVSMQSKDHIFVCSICDKTFTRRQTYRDHLLCHENPLIKCCTVCSTQFSSGIIASKHKKKFHPELYQRELNERAEERSKHGRSKTIYHTIPKNSSEISTLSENKREPIQTRSLKIVLNRVYLPGFLRNDWIYLPKKIDDYSDCMKKENIGSPNENSIWHFGDNDDCSNDTANNIKPEPQDKLIVEQNDEKQVVWKETKKDSSFYIKPEEIAHIPTFQGAKYIFNIYDERRNKKLKANKEKIKKSKLKRDTSEDNNSDVEKSKNNTGLFSKAKWGPYKSEPRTCLICGQTRTKSNIRRHVSSHCVEEDDRECRICFTSHAVPNKLREHYSRVHNVKFREYLYKMQKEKMEQSIDETVKSDYVTCNICFTNMKTSEHLKYHYEMLHNYKPGGGKSKGSLDCYICGKIFKEAQTRNLHIRRIHKKMFEGQIFCNYCGKDFMGKGFLLSHFRQVHFDENGHFKESSTKKAKYDNSKNKDKQLFMCEICGEVKETKTTMMKHRNEKHGVLDPEYGVILELV